jgi:succinate dehydrogenase/fumarate reductase flavoprotein subunit
VFGKRAGQYAAIRAQEMDSIPDTNNEQLDQEKKRINSLLNKEGEITPHKIRHELQDLVWTKLGPMRTGIDISEVIDEIQKYKEKFLPKMHISSKSKIYNREWVEALEVYQLIQVMEMIARSSVLRKESRKAFQRTDYPQLDNEQWLKNNYVKLENDEMSVITRPIVTTKLGPEEIRRGDN